jgi:hypothetical protein
LTEDRTACRDSYFAALLRAWRSSLLALQVVHGLLIEDFLPACAADGGRNK